MDLAFGDPLIVRHVLLQAAIGDARRVDANKGVRVRKVEGRDNWTEEDAAKAE